MNDMMQALVPELLHKFIVYTPKLLAGTVLLFMGWMLAWFVKRLIIRISVILKLERYLTRLSFGKAFSKADVRYGLYNFVGNIFFLVIFLIFIDFSLIVWDLKFMSDFIGDALLILPRLISAAAIFALGWFVSRWAANGLSRILIKENIPGCSAIAHYARVMLIVFFSAMALFQLNIAGEIVLIGFSTVFIALGAIAVLLVATGGGTVLRNRLEADRGQEETERSDAMMPESETGQGE